MLLRCLRYHAATCLSTDCSAAQAHADGIPQDASSPFSLHHGKSEHELQLCLQNTVTDAGGRVNVPVVPLVFTREAFPLMKGIGYQPLPSPGIQAIT